MILENWKKYSIEIGSAYEHIDIFRGIQPKLGRYKTFFYV